MNKYNVPKKEYEKVKENIGNSSSGRDGQLEYYKLNLNKYGDMGNDAPFGAIFYVGLGYPSLLRRKTVNYTGIASSGLLGNDSTNVEEFIAKGYDAIAFDPNIKIFINVQGALQLNTKNVWDYIQYWVSLGANHADDALIPITEEEFYNLD